MSLALITVGTSFREALCWDFNGTFTDPLFGVREISPVQTKVRKLRYEMGQISTEDKVKYNLQFFKNAFRKIDTTEQTWRYPAEIDTLVQFEKFKKEEFASIDKIKFIISGNEDGRFAVNILKEIFKKIWPDKNLSFEESLEYSSIDETIEFNAGLIRKIEEDLNSAKEQVFLFVTGGYKYVVIMAGIAFYRSTSTQKHLVYKHEESHLLIHSEKIEKIDICRSYRGGL